MATFKRLTNLDGTSIYVNLDLLTMIERLPAEDPSSYSDTGFPDRTLLRFTNGLDTERIVVLETPHSIVG